MELFDETILRFYRHDDVYKPERSFSDRWQQHIGRKQAVPANPRRLPVVQMDLEGNVLDTHPCSQEAAIKVHGHPITIRGACRGRSNAYGFKWKYKKDMI